MSLTSAAFPGAGGGASAQARGGERVGRDARVQHRRPRPGTRLRGAGVRL